MYHNVKNKLSSDMDRERQVEVVNICIVNALRIDEEHRMMILEKLTQSLTNENRSKLLRLLNVVGQSEQLIAFQNFLILDGQIDLEPDEVKRNAEIFLGD